MQSYTSSVTPVLFARFDSLNVRTQFISNVLTFLFQYSIDDSLPFILNIFLAQAFGVAGTVVITCYGLPWFLLVLLPLVLVYYYIQNYYRRTSR